MEAIAFGLVKEFIAAAPAMIEAGINFAGMWTQSRAVLDAAAAPDDPTWAELDKGVSDLKTRALDPSTDDR
jgi:hypothetical protein